MPGFLHSDHVQAATKGGTGDTFDKVGTLSVPVNSARAIGLNVSLIMQAATAAESWQGQCKITTKDIPALSEMIFTLDGGQGGDPATNVGNQYVLPTWIPFVARVADGASFDVYVSTHLPDPTSAGHGEADIQVEGQGMTPFGPAYLAWCAGGRMSPPAICNSYDAEVVSANTGTAGADADALYAEAGSVLWAVGDQTTPDAYEAVEGVFDATWALDISGATPFKQVLGGYHPALGTAVGIGVMARKHYSPAYVEVTNSRKLTATATIFSRVAQATGSPTTSVDLCYARKVA